MPFNHGNPNAQVAARCLRVGLSSGPRSPKVPRLCGDALNTGHVLSNPAAALTTEVMR